MLLKLNLFFWIIYIIPTVIVAVKITDFSNGRVIDMVLIAYHGFATLLALILQILAYKSVSNFYLLLCFQFHISHKIISCLIYYR